MNPYYSDDAVTIYHGRWEDVLPTLGQFDLIFTSPPYNLGVSTGGGFADVRKYPGMKTGNWSGGPLAYGYDDHDDALPPAEYEAWQRSSVLAMWEHLTPTGALFYNHKPRVQAGVLWTPLALFADPLIVRQVIVWDRGSGMNFAPTHYVPTHEWIVVAAGPAFRLAEGGSGLGDVWRLPPETGSDHPAPFPLALPARAIQSTRPAIVLDPYCGSGTTLRAAKDAGVRAVGIERSERYCEMAVKRMAQEVLDLGGVA